VASALSVPSLADELTAAYQNRQQLPLPLSSRETGFELDTAYAVEAELVRRRRASGRATVGLKVGYANKAVWRALKLETLVWAHMYDDTVTMAGDNTASVAIGRMCAPKIEPEIVFKLRAPIEAGNQDPVSILRSVEWLALGFEIVDSVYADWKFQPSDFVAAYGLHAALIVGEPRLIDDAGLSAIPEQLPTFPVRLSRNGTVVAEGSGRNSLRSPALCVAELASAVAKRSDQEPLTTGALVSSGTLTDPQPIAPGDTWSVTTDGLGLPALTLRTV
jgi:2-oxo-3-hexenedioate decarboxylase